MHLRTTRRSFKTLDAIYGKGEQENELFLPLDKGYIPAAMLFRQATEHR